MQKAGHPAIGAACARASFPRVQAATRHPRFPPSPKEGGLPWWLWHREGRRRPDPGRRRSLASVRASASRQPPGWKASSTGRSRSKDLSLATLPYAVTSPALSPMLASLHWAFEAIGGVPHRLVLDNPKPAVTRPNPHLVLHRFFLE